MEMTLRDKMRGCIAGCFLGSAMGAPTEHHSWKQIEEEYGFVVDYVPWVQPFPGMENYRFVPGTTEDGVERQKLMIAAIREKGDRVTAEDVKNSWIKNMNLKAPGTISLDFELNLRAMAESGLPGADIGKYCDYAGLNSFARACHPIGLINAGNIETAIQDIYEVGQLYQVSNSRGLKWACVTGVSIAEATKAGATVDSVLGAVFDYCDPDEVLSELEPHLNRTRGITDIRDLRVYFDDYYSLNGVDFAFASANEVVTKGLCVFQMVKGNVKDAIIAGVNIGRDCDCIAAVSSGISGALTGTGDIPQKWFDTVDYATSVNQFTSSQKKVLEYGDDVYFAYRNRIEKEKKYVAEMLYC